MPDLVFAGKIGWLTTDLMQQLGNAGIESPPEADLASLYRHCLFSVFPSLYEGWGLPVTESLSFGKTVAASNRAAIPEAGGNFCVDFDPDNITDAYFTIRGLIENPDRIATLQARIATEFHPPSWHDAAATLLALLGVRRSTAYRGTSDDQLEPYEFKRPVSRLGLIHVLLQPQTLRPLISAFPPALRNCFSPPATP